LEKSLSAFRTISEVASELDVPKHVLRFWEGKFTQLRPMKRGGGRRYYRPEDVDLLRGIRWLLYSDGYTIKGVQRILRDNGVRFVKECWRGGGQTADMAAANGGVRDIPNLAGEAAAEARKSRAIAAKPGPDADKAADARARGKEQTEAQVLVPRTALKALLGDLEDCRAQLGSRVKTDAPLPGGAKKGRGETRRGLQS
jgi:DNA-binding transcriptional MerR regulator